MIHSSKTFESISRRITVLVTMLPARFPRNKLCRAVEKNKRKDDKAAVVELIEILGILRTNVREYIR